MPHYCLILSMENNPEQYTLVWKDSQHAKRIDANEHEKVGSVVSTGVMKRGFSSVDLVTFVPSIPLGVNCFSQE